VTGGPWWRCWCWMLAADGAKVAGCITLGSIPGSMEASMPPGPNGQCRLRWQLGSRRGGWLAGHRRNGSRHSCTLYHFNDFICFMKAFQGNKSASVLGLRVQAITIGHVTGLGARHGADLAGNIGAINNQLVAMALRQCALRGSH